jgi:hypothetical protein
MREPGACYQAPIIQPNRMTRTIRDNADPGFVRKGPVAQNVPNSAFVFERDELQYPLSEGDP